MTDPRPRDEGRTCPRLAHHRHLRRGRRDRGTGLPVHLLIQTGGRTRAKGRRGCSRGRRALLLLRVIRGSGSRVVHDSGLLLDPRHDAVRSCDRFGENI